MEIKAVLQAAQNTKAEIEKQKEAALLRFTTALVELVREGKIDSVLIDNDSVNIQCKGKYAFIHDIDDAVEALAMLAEQNTEKEADNG